jgi:hypothetical protein
MKTLTIHNPNHLPTRPFTDFVDFQGDFKLPMTPKAQQKLARSLIKHGVFVPEFVWIDPQGQAWTLDGHQRNLTFRALEADGWTIPPIPYVLIEAATKKEAKEKFLQISSEYAEKNPETTFIHETWPTEQELKSIFDEIEIPQLTPDFRPTIAFQPDVTARDGREMTSGDSKAATSQPKLVTLFLNQDQFEQWENYKIWLGVKADTKAFLVMLEESA